MPPQAVQYEFQSQWTAGARFLEKGKMASFDLRCAKSREAVRLKSLLWGRFGIECTEAALVAFIPGRWRHTFWPLTRITCVALFCLAPRMPLLACSLSSTSLYLSMAVMAAICLAVSAWIELLERAHQKAFRTHALTQSSSSVLVDHTRSSSLFFILYSVLDFPSILPFHPSHSSLSFLPCAYNR